MVPRPDPLPVDGTVLAPASLFFTYVYEEYTNYFQAQTINGKDAIPEYKGKYTGPSTYISMSVYMLLL